MGSCKLRWWLGAHGMLRVWRNEGLVGLGARRAPQECRISLETSHGGEEKPFEAAPAAAVTPKLL